MGRVGMVWYNTRSLVLDVLLRRRQALLRRMGMMKLVRHRRRLFLIPRNAARLLGRVVFHLG
jgi:hypothetical protein